jgi:hypothetical protein
MLPERVQLARRVEDALLPLLLLHGWQVFAGERETQSRRTFVSVRLLERTFFAFKFR